MRLIVLRATWLALVSGAADAAGWTGTGVFPAHMTGNTALIGVSLFERHWHLAFVRLVVVAAFFAGLLLSPALGMRKRLGTPASVWGASGFALAAALVRVQPWDVVLLAVALAMQNAALHQFGGKSINTSFLTGTLQSLAMTVSRHALGRDNGEDAAGDRVTMRVVPAVWLTYVAGAAIGALLAVRLHYGLLPISLAIPVVLLFLGRDDGRGQG